MLLIAIFAAFYQTDPVQFGKIYTEETIQLLQISSGGVVGSLGPGT